MPRKLSLRLGRFCTEAEGKSRNVLKLPDWSSPIIVAPAELALRGFFLSDVGVKTRIGENWSQSHLADGELYSFLKKSMRI